MNSGIPLLREFPIVQIPVNETDNNHRGLMWEKRAAQYVTERYGYPEIPLTKKNS